MTPISCIIVEDEPLAQERLKGYIQRSSALQLQGCFDSALAAWDYLEKKQVDLIFLDINMEGLSGIELLETRNITSHVVITTAYHDFAIKGFDLNVADYLLKPFTIGRFMQAIEKVQQLILKPVSRQEKGFLFVKTAYRLEKIMLDDILYIEGKRDYRKIVTRTKSVMTLQTFKELEAELPVNQVVRVHKSYMVAIPKIDSVEKDLIRIGQVMIPVSETYKRQFHQVIGSNPS
jgi:two-component system, LytTR family, response regulator